MRNSMLAIAFASSMAWCSTPHNNIDLSTESNGVIEYTSTAASSVILEDQEWRVDNQDNHYLKIWNNRQQATCIIATSVKENFWDMYAKHKEYMKEGWVTNERELYEHVINVLNDLLVFDFSSARTIVLEMYWYDIRSINTKISCV